MDGWIDGWIDEGVLGLSSVIHTRDGIHFRRRNGGQKEGEKEKGEKRKGVSEGK